MTRSVIITELLITAVLALFALTHITQVSTKSINATLCSKSRKILFESWGVVSNGPENVNYAHNSYCEWLIKANPKQFISLKFDYIRTECSYDYIHIYDGDSYYSPLIGTFSGVNVPRGIIASSGYMLILLNSDANYELSGFSANYSITDCPNNCTDNGSCFHHICLCAAQFTGSDCSQPICPDDCGFPSRGNCKDGRCICNKGYSGQTCSLSLNKSAPNTWHNVYSNGVARAGHTSVYDPGMDALYVFGGFDLNKVFGDLVIFDFNKSIWLDEHGNNYESSVSENLIAVKNVFSNEEEPQMKWGLKSQTIFQNILLTLSKDLTIKSLSDYSKWNRSNNNETPEGRYWHSTCGYPGGFVIYGGKLSDGSLSNELWLYDVKKREWSLRAKDSSVTSPRLIQHTITLVDDEYVYLLGGINEYSDYSSEIFRIRLKTVGGEEMWERIIPRGGKQFDYKISGHTAVYHALSQSLVVYGGITANNAKVSMLSDRILMFNTVHRHWTEVKHSRSGNKYVPRERAFHTANIIGNYMVVVGGYFHHNKEETCYDSAIYFYHLFCHTWISHDITSLPHGIYSHSSGVRNGGTLLLVGGYRGSISSDFKAYTVPLNVEFKAESTQQELERVCDRHESWLECTSDPQCGWCSSDEKCYARNGGVNCTTNLQTTRCPGICPSLMDCRSCLLHGNSIPSPLNRILQLDKCTWCIQNARCHHKHDAYGVCGLQEDTPSHVAGWWGDNGLELTNASQCATLDRSQRPSFTLVKYFDPLDFNYPDQVTLTNCTDVQITVPPSEMRVGNTVCARMMGFLRVESESPIQMEICVSQHTSASVTFSLRGDPNTTSSYSVHSEDVWKCDGFHYPHNGIVEHSDGKILVDFWAKKVITRDIKEVLSTMQLRYMTKQHNFKVFTFENLQPFESNTSCSEYSNCLHCLTDTHCVWCDVTEECVIGNGDPREICTISNSTDWKHFVINPSECGKCSNHADCDSCVSSKSCEWSSSDGICDRRGRRAASLEKMRDCPMPCHKRETCAECLNMDKCAWCHSNNECFPFSSYSSRYQFGLCSHWSMKEVEKNVEMTCDICSQRKNCLSCLTELSCGWDFDSRDSTSGKCVPGDFHGRYNGTEHVASAVAKWAYAQCPDVDECRLGLHDCHAYAECINTRGSYSCQCLRGFVGDGKHSCTKTCYHKCMHGHCVDSGDYSCECNFGWTGVDCSVDCGCNFHATCSEGVNACDKCGNNTAGEKCQFCQLGTYGNATELKGCTPCNCNGHGNGSLGFCNNTTGDCFCAHNTDGKQCETCKKGFYGDPRNDGKCYLKCDARSVQTSYGPENFGSKSQVPSNKLVSPLVECLWIIKPDYSKQKPPPIIQITVESDINVPCHENSVYVYNGIPEFMPIADDKVTPADSHHSNLLAVFCTQHYRAKYMAEVTSGIMTVFYKHSGKWNEGFNATYRVLDCGNNCFEGKNRVCVGDKCVCKAKYADYDCDKILCLNNCTASQGHGTCNLEYGRCDCAENYVSSDCSHAADERLVISNEMFNTKDVSDCHRHLRKMLPRFGHSAMADHRKQLWLFGGYSLSHGPLNDMRLFDLKNNTWMQVTIDSTTNANMPQGRFFHAADLSTSQKEIYVHGGITEGQAILDDFWRFHLESQSWVPMNVKGRRKPPALAGHSLTAFFYEPESSFTIIIIGGFNKENGFSHSFWQFHFEEEIWSKLSCSNCKWPALVGHTSVYHAPTRHLYVFGGKDHKSISNGLYAYHISHRTWSILPALMNGVEEFLPRGRYMHTAVTNDNYMLIYGGHVNGEVGQDASLIAYYYFYNQWVELSPSVVGIVGELPPHIYGHGMTMDQDSGEVYIVGAFPGQMEMRVTRFHIPNDICSLFSGGNNTQKFRTFVEFCEKKCHLQQEGVRKNCLDSIYYRRSKCSKYTECSKCSAHWPIDTRTVPDCKWCDTCVKCIPYEQPCSIYCHNSIGDDLDDFSNKSPDAPCEYCRVSNCEECKSLLPCVWTRQVLNTDPGFKITGEPIYNWDCVERDITAKSSIKLKVSATCPPRCSTHKTCDTCLSSEGAEGGWHECRWLEKLQMCTSPAYLHTYCVGGNCGLVLGGDKKYCPMNCSSHVRCSDCLSFVHCGWCSLNRNNTTGQGMCVDTSLYNTAVKEGNEGNYCSDVFGDNSTENDTFDWNYLKCPAENECENNHDTCDKASQYCVDLKEGYTCRCREGFEPMELSEMGSREWPFCAPICEQGCIHGTCESPGKCRCKFGFTADDCSFLCACNGHSDCAGPDKLDVCVECHNNTEGAQCGQCKPMHVGDAWGNGVCVPCSEYCNGHTHVCVMIAEEKGLASVLDEDISAPKAQCMSCANNTSGMKCDDCAKGFFRGSQDLRDGCRPCQCQGHGEMCDPVTGDKCDCANNTESDRNCHLYGDGGAIPDCWMVQCSKCRETFLGTPTKGRQCYKHMIVDMKYCFDAKPLQDCRLKQKPLFSSQASFFAVQPRYMNVNIRLIIDVTQGTLDVYVAPTDDLFVKNKNESFHLDKTFMQDENMDREWSVQHDAGLYSLEQHAVEGVITSVKINNDRRSVLAVKNLNDRLVVTFPHDRHDLSTVRFYVALIASDKTSRPVYGAIYFRQDQLRIDLFVFFSVFFSCFFLLLASCILVWKLRVAAELRRERRREEMNRMDMLNRPYPSVTILLDYPYMCEEESKASFVRSPQGAGGSHSPPLCQVQKRVFPNKLLAAKRQASPRNGMRPIAIEPTGDGQAAVITMVVTMPAASRNGSRKLVMASALVQLSRSYGPNKPFQL